VATLAPGATVVGLRFRPGVGPKILGIPTSDLVDFRVELDQLWGRSAAILGQRLAEAGSPDAAAALLEQEISARSAIAPGPDPLVTEAVRRLQPWRAEAIGDVTSDLFISQRQLRRRFVAALGFGPKALHRILRFQAFLALTDARNGRENGLAQLAADAGYADQAHLARECFRLAGLSPTAFLAELGRSCGSNHDHAASFFPLSRALLAVRALSPARTGSPGR
jgi:AraC-like DNA-binding protein